MTIEHATSTLPTTPGCGTLAQLLKTAPPSPAEAARLVELLARAVHAGHDKDVIRGDLKPANVLLTEGGGVRPADPAGRTADAPEYLAPEQTRGDGAAVGPRTDVYGLGAVLYECLTGRPPFERTTLARTLAHVRKHDPVPPSRRNPAVPPDLEAICLKCLEKNPADRYETAADLADDLWALQQGLPTQVQPLGRWGRGWRWCRRNPVTSGVVAATALLLVLGGVGTLLVLGERRERARQRDEEQAALVERPVKKEITTPATKKEVPREEPKKPDDDLLAGQRREREQRLRTGLDAVENHLRREEWTQAEKELASVEGDGGNADVSQELRDRYTRLTAGIKTAREKAANDHLTRAKQQLAGKAWDKVPQELAQARSAAGTGSAAPDLEARRQQIEKSVTFAEQLEEARVRRCRMPTFVYDYTPVTPEAVFRANGLDLLALAPEEAVRRLKGSDIADELLGAVDNWCWAVREFTKGPRREQLTRLVTVACAANPDPQVAKLRQAMGGSGLEIRELAVDLYFSRGRSDKPQLPLPSLLFLAEALARSEEFARASDLLERANTAFPGNFWVNQRLAESHFFHKRRGRVPQIDLKEALPYYEAVRGMRPTSPVVSHNLAVAYAHGDDFGRAKGEFEKCLELRKNNILALHNLGTAYLDYGSLDKALATFKEALAVQKDYWPSQINLGLALARKMNTAAAEKELRTALRLAEDLVKKEPDDPGHLHNLCHSEYNLAQVIRDGGNLNDAKEIARRVKARLTKLPKQAREDLFELEEKVDALIADNGMNQ